MKTTMFRTLGPYAIAILLNVALNPLAVAQYGDPVILEAVPDAAIPAGIMLTDVTPVVASHAETVPDPEAGDQDDPSYKLYKEGYSFILDENWSAAAKKFDRMLKEFPASKHREGAEYWSAHALMHIDRKKAKERYHTFINAHPGSRFYDDAIADLEQLDARSFTITAAGEDSMQIYIHDGGKGYNFSTAPKVLELDRSMRLFERQMRRLRVVHIPGFPWWVDKDDEKEDPATRLKLEALEAIGEMKEDEKSFQMLRDIAVDKAQPRKLRFAAIEGLSSFTKHDVMSVYLDIAKHDTSEELQIIAIEYISQMPADKKRSVTALVDLFKALPEHRDEQQQTVLFSIAEIGNDRAIDFLVSVARTHPRYELRSDAVYLLGNIGGERARSALYEILRGK